MPPFIKVCLSEQMPASAVVVFEIEMKSEKKETGVVWRTDCRRTASSRNLSTANVDTRQSHAKKRVEPENHESAVQTRKASRMARTESDERMTL